VVTGLASRFAPYDREGGSNPTPLTPLTPLISSLLLLVKKMQDLLR
jgi:hypothetical protein